MGSSFICLSNVFVKKLTYISPGQLALIRNAGILVFNIPIAIWSTKNAFGAKNQLLFLIFRGSIVFIAVYLQILSYRLLPIAEAAIIMSSTPAVVFVSAYFCLKESCGYVQVFALAVTTIGTLIAIRIPELLRTRMDIEFDSMYLAGLASAVGSVVLLSFAFVILRKMTDIYFSVILIHCGWTGVLLNGLLTAVFESYALPRCGWDTFLTFLIGILPFIGDVVLTVAFQIENAGIVATMRSAFDIISAAVFQVIFFGIAPDFYNIVGAILILISLATLGFRSWLLSLPVESYIRKKFRYLIT